MQLSSRQAAGFPRGVVQPRRQFNNWQHDQAGSSVPLDCPSSAVSNHTEACLLLCLSFLTCRCASHAESAPLRTDGTPYSQVQLGQLAQALQQRGMAVDHLQQLHAAMAARLKLQAAAHAPSQTTHNIGHSQVSLPFSCQSQLSSSTFHDKWAWDAPRTVCCVRDRLLMAQGFCFCFLLQISLQQASGHLAAWNGRQKPGGFCRPLVARNPALPTKEGKQGAMGFFRTC